MIVASPTPATVAAAEAAREAKRLRIARGRFERFRAALRAKGISIPEPFLLSEAWPRGALSRRRDDLFPVMAIPKWKFRFTRPGPRERIDVPDMLREFHRAMLLGMEIESLEIDDCDSEVSLEPRQRIPG